MKIREAVKGMRKDKHNKLPENSYFLSDTAVVCYPRKHYGDSRYPYYRDGLVMFAHTSGYIDCVEGMFNVFRCAYYNEDTPVCFYAGEQMQNGFFPISVTGAARQLCEPMQMERYVVFTPVCAWYIAETAQAVYAVRVFVDADKHLHFSLGAVNLGKERSIYLSSFFEPMLSYDDAEGFYHRMIKYGEHFENGNYLMHSRNTSDDCLAIRVSVEGNVCARHYTTAKKTFLARGGANLTNAGALAAGQYTENISKTNTTDIPCVSDMIHFSMKTGDFAQISYEMLVCDVYETAFKFAIQPTEMPEIDAAVYHAFEVEHKVFETMDIRFSKMHDTILESDVLNNFLKCVQRQVSFCALGKNYAGPMLGIRDVFQQLETALIWQPTEARRQMVRVMDSILSTGRAPRQISFPTREKPIPDMDLRPFIDQGFWIISTFHTYLSYTDDTSILNENCGYYCAKDTFGPLEKTEERDSVLEHLIRIMDYLIENIDENTGCVHALWGDWNDALDGLGKTQDPDREFGTGVSVMATEQLYLAFTQMCDILQYVGGYTERLASYQAKQKQLVEDFRSYAVDEQDGNVRILHGWGDKRAYLVGSFCDYDGKARLSLTSNAFFAISGLSDCFPELKESVSNNLLSMDSKFGLLTFDTAFATYASEVGRISTITPGTFENRCVYTHASLFGIMALFAMGHAEQAWKLMEKAMVITHDSPTKTTFAMPNSYCYNEEYFADGDSMNDWYTGSGTVLLKAIVRHALGIMPNPNGLLIIRPSYLPAECVNISLHMKGIQMQLEYTFRDGICSIACNGRRLEPQYDRTSDSWRIYLSNANLKAIF